MFFETLAAFLLKSNKTVDGTAHKDIKIPLKNTDAKAQKRAQKQDDNN